MISSGDFLRNLANNHHSHSRDNNFFVELESKIVTEISSLHSEDSSDHIAMGELGTLYEDSPHLRDGGSWQFTYMYFLGLIIGGGTSQIQKNIISERGLGLPREPKVQGV